MVLSHNIRQTVALVLLVFGLSPMAYAEKPVAAEIDLDGSVNMIREQTGGRVLSAETRSRDGRAVHHIRVLTPRGKVKRFRLDAGTGERLPAKGRR